MTKKLIFYKIETLMVTSQQHKRSQLDWHQNWSQDTDQKNRYNN